MPSDLAAALDLLSRVFADARLGSVHLREQDLIDQVSLLQRVINVASAAQAVRVAQFAARDDVQLPDGSWETRDLGAGHVGEFAGDAFAPELGLSPVAAERRAHTAACWVSRLPATLSAMGSGDLDPWRATVIADELQFAESEVCSAVEGTVFPAVLGDTPGQVRRRVRKALAVVDADSVRARAGRALADRFVRVQPGEVPGVCAWSAVLPTDVSMSCWAAVDELAHRGRGDGDERSLDQARADALGELILGSATVTTTAHLMIPVHVPDQVCSGNPALGVGDASVAAPESSAWFGAVDVPGVGVIPAPVVQQICGRFDTRIARVLLDSRTGVTLETGIATYRPPANIRSFVQLRDGTCRFPGCARAARRCEADHVTPWPRGDTAPANLASLCKHHHRAKHEAGWRLCMTAEGVCTWTDRFGHRYVTHPRDHWPMDVAGSRQSGASETSEAQHAPRPPTS